MQFIEWVVAYTGAHVDIVQAHKINKEPTVQKALILHCKVYGKFQKLEF